MDAITPKLKAIEAETVAPPALAGSDCSIAAVLESIGDDGLPRATAATPVARHLCGPSSVNECTVKESKAVKNRIRLCLSSHYAKCQAKLEHLDTAGTRTCWTSLPKNPLVDQSVPDCIAAFDDEVTALKACLRLPEKTETELEAKAKCLGMPPRKSMAPNNTESPFKRNSCGPLSLDEAIAATEQSTSLATRRTDLKRKLEPFRQRRNATDAVCGNYAMLDMQQRRLREQKDIERESGVVDLQARRQIGQMIALVKRWLPQNLADFKKAHGRVFNRRRDCSR